TGLAIELPAAADDALAALFSEEPGAVVQVRTDELDPIMAYLAQYPMLARHVHELGRPDDSGRVTVTHAGATVFEQPLFTLLEDYSALTHAMQRLRDNPETADAELRQILDPDDPGLSIALPDAAAARMRVTPPSGARPRVAILREQGVNGHLEMAAAFTRAGFEAVDVHMTDVLGGSEDLTGMRGLAVCGGFSYGDVLGAGRGWAGTIRHDPRAADVFRAFFARPDTFTFGVCNGCQMLAELSGLIPGAAHWPRFRRNLSEQFEARLALVEVLPSPSLMLDGLAGLRAPVAVAHAEGRAEWAAGSDPSAPCLRFVDHHGQPATGYPQNPNGSPDGITGLSSDDGRATIMMPHPERVFLARQMSWKPRNWGAAESPWMALFHNARRWVG
ncbi:MAG: phosphoribosylformylglycinamidine synthase subunit PurQ, partial [Gammaproteobacteria bacterium]